ncbi:hypothetical protein GQ42DRAFT_160257 [Ramicandelaber brevisporus]|nr:hypothetical protein GQ42DRAFT_160257 [Ramicandelaber brevisporus]
MRLFASSLAVAVASAFVVGGGGGGGGEVVSATSSPLARLAEMRQRSSSSSSSSSREGETRARVPVELFVMSRCPDAFACEDTWFKVMDQVEDIVRLTLTYIARAPDTLVGAETNLIKSENVEMAATAFASNAAETAATTFDDEAQYGVVCKHGVDECRGNVEQLCVHNMQSHNAQSWFTSFVKCINENKRDIGRSWTQTQRCLGRLPSDERVGVNELKKCVQGADGRVLAVESMLHARSLNVTRSCTVHIAGKHRCLHDNLVWVDDQCPGGSSVEDFVKTVCQEYLKNPGTRNSDSVPAACRKYL